MQKLISEIAKYVFILQVIVDFVMCAYRGAQMLHSAITTQYSASNCEITNFRPNFVSRSMHTTIPGSVISHSTEILVCTFILTT